MIKQCPFCSSADVEELGVDWQDHTYTDTEDLFFCEDCQRYFDSENEEVYNPKQGTTSYDNQGIYEAVKSMYTSPLDFVDDLALLAEQGEIAASMTTDKAAVVIKAYKATQMHLEQRAAELQCSVALVEYIETLERRLGVIESALIANNI